MDTSLKQLMEMAAMRGSRYVKGEVAQSDLREKMAELGVLLLEKAQRLPDFDVTRKKEELIDLQNKMDDLRRAIFEEKIR